MNDTERQLPEDEAERPIEPPTSGGSQPDPQSDSDLEDASIRVLRQLFVAMNTRRLRGAADPLTREAQEALLATIAELSDSSASVRIGRSGPHVMLNMMRVRPHLEIKAQLQALWSDLDQLGIGGFEIDSAIGAEDLDLFLELYPNLGRALEETGLLEKTQDPMGRERWSIPNEIELVPGVKAFPYKSEIDVAIDPDRRNRARRTFFRALRAARLIFRQSQVNRLTELRKTRAVVHEMIDTLVDEEFSLLGLSAMHSFDAYTFQHSVHVSVLSMAVGQRLGLARSELSQLGVAAMFHDMGKTRVPKKVLWKPGRFGKDEWKIMHKHPLSGARELLQFGGMSDLAVRVMLVSAEHHMRFDGSGYPKLEDDWTQGLFSRIVTLADCFDAMTASRVYMKRPFTPDAVVRYMIENAGRMFDPDLLRVFVGLVGLYPVGSMVRLESGELGLVAEPPSNPREVNRPQVRILEPGVGGLTPGETRSLADGPEVDPRFRVAAGCHPQDFGISVDDLLARLYIPEAELSLETAEQTPEAA